MDDIIVYTILTMTGLLILFLPIILKYIIKAVSSEAEGAEGAEIVISIVLMLYILSSGYVYYTLTYQ